MTPGLSCRESENFQTLKAGAILVVLGGHFFADTFPLVWVPVAFALLVFAYASAYFTSCIYGERINLGKYWRNKVERLGSRLLFVDVFLFLIFLWQGRSGVFTWQTVVNLIGLQGLLEWFGLANPSPFGGGMWFFTMLLIFYGAYPLLARIYRDGRTAAWVTAGYIGLAWGLQQLLPYGHALWLTSCGFFLGLMVSRSGMEVPRIWLWGATALVATVALAANAYGVTQFNFFLFLALFLPGVALWHRSRMPKWLHETLRPLQGCLLETYLLHSHLVIYPAGIAGVDFVGSLALTLGVAKMLAWLGARISTRSMRAVSAL